MKYLGNNIWNVSDNEVTYTRSLISIIVVYIHV